MRFWQQKSSLKTKIDLEEAAHYCAAFSWGDQYAGSGGSLSARFFYGNTVKVLIDPFGMQIRIATVQSQS
jgi:hypothetical protein